MQIHSFSLQELLKQFLLIYRYCTCNFRSNKKVQSQRFALQEWLKQFLLVYRYCTSIFLYSKKVQSQRFALQEWLKQFLLVYRYCTCYFRSNKKDEYTSYRIAFIFLYLLGLDTDFSFCFNIQNIFFLIGIWITFSLFVY